MTSSLANTIRLNSTTPRAAPRQASSQHTYNRLDNRAQLTNSPRRHTGIVGHEVLFTILLVRVSVISSHFRLDVHSQLSISQRSLAHCLSSLLFTLS